MEQMDPISRAKKCLDTYALMEIIHKNKQFTELLDEAFIVPDAVLAELYDVLLRTHNKETADYWYKRFSLYGIPVPHSLLKDAVVLRRTNKKLNLSLTDAAGYLLAQHLGLPFVTGDQAFEGMAGVDFRK